MKIKYKQQLRKQEEIGPELTLKEKWEEISRQLKTKKWQKKGRK